MAGIDVSKPVKHRPENPKQKDAFDEFIRTGANAGDKNMGEIGDKFGVSRTTIENWYSWYNWRARATQRELAIRPKIEERTNNEVADVRAGLLSEVDEGMVLNRFAIRNAGIVDGKTLTGTKIEPKSARDLNYLMSNLVNLGKLKLNLLGEPDERSEVKIVIDYGDSG